MSFSHRVGWIALFACGGPLAHAQRMPDPGHDLQLIESTERNEDPLGIDESTGKELDHAAARLPKPVVVLPTASQGAALSSIAGVREAEHDVQVELAQGLAFVHARIRIGSTAKHAAELAYRYPLPVDGVVTRLRACVQGRCSEAVPGESKQRGSIALSGEPIEDAQGHALAVRAAPIAPGTMLELELDYVAEAPLQGGRAHFRLPARGYDPNLAPSSVRLTSAHLRDIAPASELSVDAWTPVALSASLPGRVHEQASAPCGTASCRRSFDASASATAAPRNTVLLIDASPSMEGPARSRVGLVLAAVLGVLPDDTDVRALAFAARARELGHFRADAAPLTQLSDATMLELDAATQPASALALLDVARTRPRIVVLSDGLFDASKREHDALLDAQRKGGDTWLLALGDVPPRLTAAFAHVLTLGARAEAALHDGELGPLEDAVRALAERPLAGGAIAGEARVREQRPKAAWTPAAGAPWLSFWMLRHAAPLRFGLDGPGEGAIPAIPYVSKAAHVATVDTSMPAQSVLSMLRDQLVPQARACLRADRKGRANYAVGLSFHALFAQREVYEARVEGTIPRELRQCLESILPKLRVPQFSGRIRVRYPIHTEREEQPPAIELEPEVSRDLSRVFSPAPALP